MPTIKDVARLAGVGVGTASRVISGNGSFSKAAAERVESAARELGFRPSAIARALSMQCTGTIGIFVPDFNGPFYGPLLQAIDAELRQQGRHMVAANGCGDEDTRRQSLDGARFLIERECDGIILCSNALRDADFAQLRDDFSNIAIVNRDVRGMKNQCFTVDHRAAGRLAADALLEHGHRRIAVISGPQGAGDNHQRLQGLFDRLAEDGIRAGAVLVEQGDFSPRSGWDAAARLIARKSDVTALFCANDQMAMGALSCVQHHGIAVPRKWSVLGYDDVDIAPFLSPRLTSVRIPIAEMGLNACRMLLNVKYGSQLEVSHRFKPTLAMRDSLARIG
ncbi:MAG: LacI family DNA-binding transcriptional regulator [Burkholderiaceae bacterium]